MLNIIQVLVKITITMYKLLNELDVIITTIMLINNHFLFVSIASPSRKPQGKSVSLLYDLRTKDQMNNNLV